MTVVQLRMATFFIVVAITSVASRKIEWKINNSTDDMTKLRMISIDKFEEDAIELLPEDNSNDESENNSGSGLMFNMPIIVAVSISLVLLICCCFCCTRFIVQYDEFRKSRYYEISRKQRAAEIARSLKINETPVMMNEKFDHIKT